MTNYQQPIPDYPFKNAYESSTRTRFGKAFRTTRERGEFHTCGGDKTSADIATTDTRDKSCHNRAITLRTVFKLV
jgi:hypothetical protein